MALEFSGGKIVPRGLEEEMRRSYIDYAMSVIVDRALPDVRDGLKPVQRRILYGMAELGTRPDRPHKKSARIVGEVMGKFHPHGDSAIYDAMVRMAQRWSYRYLLVDGHGNFGCFTGDTKIKLLDGTEKSFAELAQLGPDARFHVYSVDKNGRIVVGEGRNARVTRRKAQLIEVTLDTGEQIRCTPDHRFLLKSGAYKQAKDLTPADSLMAGYFSTAPVRPDTNDYLRIRQPDGEWDFVHHLADKYNEDHGRVPERTSPWVRHHKNFDRWDNRPDNIQRVTWKEHQRIHAEHLATLWTDQDFRTTQREGVKRYYRDHPEAREARRQRMIVQNQSKAFRVENGKRLSQVLKGYYLRHPDKRESLSAGQRARWRDPDFRAKMSAALTGLDKRELTPEEKARVAATISVKSTKMWSDPRKKAEIRRAIRAAMEDPVLRGKLSTHAKGLWKDPQYRNKFPATHFRKMALALWSDPRTREMHRDKIKRQRQNDPDFVRNQSQAVSKSNKRRLAANPTMMQELAQNAAETLTKKWKTPEYKRQVMRSKIAGFVSRILAKHGKETFSPALYDSARDANWIPKYKQAIRHFDDMDDLLQEAENYNHRVIRIRWIDEREDVYDITVDHHHNFLLASNVFVHNSVDGDPPAAMRYTEARLSRPAMEMLRDIDKDTVNFEPNFDETLEQPTVLPARFPNLLVNGAAGIAVGMATNIPPHNLGEIIDGLVMMIDQPEITTQELMRVIKGPDFPTGALILGRDGIKNAYETGRGRVRMRAKCQIEEMSGGKQRIIVDEIPYMVNKATLITKIAELVREKHVDGITDLRDESDRSGMRIVMELRRDANPHVVLNRLYKHSQLEDTFGVIMLALVDGEPKVLNLRDALHHYLRYQEEIIIRRTKFELQKAEDRAHILEGLRIALDNIDEIIALIRGSQNDATAKEGLMSKFGLSEKQAVAILDMQLRRLTGLERDKIETEYKELQETIARLKEILGDIGLVYGLIKEELLEIKEKFADDRRTEITGDSPELEMEDLIADEDMVVTLTHQGYIKRLPLTTYRSQRRGGRGIAAIHTKQEDFVEQLFVTTTHSHILFFTNRGRVFRLKGHQIPEAGRNARGVAIVNLLNVERGEVVNAAIPIRTYDDEHFLLMATKRGIVKKTVLSDFDSPRAGLIGISLVDDDELVGVHLTDGGEEVVLATRQGQAIVFAETDVRSMGRGARGVKGIRLGTDDSVVGMDVVRADAQLLVVSEKGYGKRTPLDDYRRTARGGKGIKTLHLTNKNGPVVGVKVIREGEEVMTISAQGIMIRMRAEDISCVGRNAQGVRLMRLGEGDYVVAMAQLAAKEE